MFDKINAGLAQGNVEDMSKWVQSDSIDCIVAPLVLHLVENPEIFLRDCYRVLQMNGVAGFSVWGDKLKSTFFSMAERLIEEYYG